jgi:hypothetical protein
MQSNSRQILFIPFATLVLGSCSYGYDLLAVAIDGRLAFIVDPHSSYKPDCVGEINVSVEKGGPLARPGPGDDKGLVRNGGVYWWKSTEVTSCENRFPILYGQQIKGPLFNYENGPSSVEAKPLRIGVFYGVNASGAGAYGSVWFRISRTGHIDNFRSDPAPPVVNAEGYDVTDYANMAQPPDEGTYYPGKS